MTETQRMRDELAILLQKHFARGGTMALSPSLEILASMSRDDLRDGGFENYAKYGERAYTVARELTWMRRQLREALGTVYTSLLFADDVRRLVTK